MLRAKELQGVSLVDRSLVGDLSVVLLASRAIAAPLDGAQFSIGQGQRVSAEVELDRSGQPIDVRSGETTRGSIDTRAQRRVAGG